MRLCGLNLAILVAVLALLFAILTKDLPKQFPNSPQDCFQDHPNEPQTLKKPAKVMEGCSFLHFNHFPNNHSKMLQKYPPKPPPRLKVAANMAILAPSWRASGADLIHPACILSPFSHQLCSNTPQHRARDPEKQPTYPTRPPKWVQND